MGSSSSRRFLVLHGWQNRRPPAHWQWRLTEALRTAGEQVLYPQLPDPDHPSLADWSELVRAELAQLGGGERVVIAHSLAAVLWLHTAGGLTAHERVTRVLLVSPPSPAFLATAPEVAAFAEIRPDPAAVAAAAATTRIVASDNDPCCPEGVLAVYGALGLETDIIPAGGHLTPDSGYGTWPAALAWCLDPATRLTPNSATSPA